MSAFFIFQACIECSMFMKIKTQLQIMQQIDKGYKRGGKEERGCDCEADIADAPLQPQCLLPERNEVRRKERLQREAEK